MKRGKSQSGQLIVAGSGNVVFQDIFPEAGPYTVQFDVIPPAINSFLALAKIAWSVGGNNIFRQVSVGQGVSISGIAEAVNVSVVDATPPTIINAGEIYTLTVACVPGIRPTINQPPILKGTNGTIVGGGAGTAVIAVPTNAGVNSCRIYLIDTAGGHAATAVNAVVTMVDSADAITFKQYLLTPEIQATFVPVTPGTANVVIANPNADGIGFSLEWGIDG